MPSANVVMEQVIQNAFTAINTQINECIEQKTSISSEIHALTKQISTIYDLRKSELQVCVYFDKFNIPQIHRGNYIILLWMWKNRKEIEHTVKVNQGKAVYTDKQKLKEPLRTLKLELYTILYNELLTEGIDMQFVKRVKAQSCSLKIAKVTPIKF
ncbi:MAG TPA: hypothetical protein DCQ28_15095 [Bacteroidetes bacterium]|nr:hypothetical protein [Bacteroidota bacterium]